MDKVRLKVLGLSYSQTQTGAYALILEAEGSEHRIPIIIGSFEAQSIAIQLENLSPPRPLTHDLFLNLSMQFGIGLREVFIYKLDEGVFHSRLVFQNERQKIELDARTSDGVALALRFDSPIFTTQEIIDKAGIIIQLENEESEESEETQEIEKAEIHTEPQEEKIDANNLNSKSINELKDLLNKAIEQEEYEIASRINEELNKRG